MPDHIHVVTSYTPDLSIAKLTEGLKSNSSRWIGENKLTTIYLNGREDMRHSVFPVHS